MKGNITVKVNNASLVEAMQDYFDRQLANENRMTVKSVVADSTSYSGATLQIDVTLTEKEAAEVTK